MTQQIRDYPLSTPAPRASSARSPSGRRDSSRIRVWLWALFSALVLHASLVLIASLFEKALWADARFYWQSEPTIEIAVDVGDGDSSAGGGAVVVGQGDEQFSESLAKRDSQDEAAQVIAPRPMAPTPKPDFEDVRPEPQAEKETDAKPASIAAAEEKLFDETQDWFEQDLLLAESGDDATTLPARPDSAFKHLASARSFAAAPLPGKRLAENSRYAGMGPGRHGGPGGYGRANGTPRFVEEDFVFGGTDGAFLGRMCFVPRGLRSLKELGACRTELQFRTNEINIPPRDFSLGFPGFPERDEWFSVLYTGDFKVREAGVYAFRVLSDDGSVLHINGRAVVDNDGVHGPWSERGEIELSAGSHRLELWYFQGPRMLIALQLFVRPPNGAGERLMTPEL